MLQDSIETCCILFLAIACPATTVAPPNRVRLTFSPVDELCREVSTSFAKVETSPGTICMTLFCITDDRDQFASIILAGVSVYARRSQGARSICFSALLSLNSHLPPFLSCRYLTPAAMRL